MLAYAFFFVHLMGQTRDHCSLLIGMDMSKMNDIPPHFLAAQHLPPEDGMTHLERVTCVVVAVVIAVFGIAMLLFSVGVWSQA